MDSTTIKDGYWQEITSEFLSSVKQLNLGELLKSEHLTLFEAMSAIELMDPKMDSGMVLKKTNRKILTFEQAVRAGTVKINQLELSELIGIIDETYSCLATWLEGHALALTLMTNLYLHEPERIEDRCLRIFSFSILNLANRLNNLVQAVFCIEEEDFQLNVGRFNLVAQISDQKLLSSIEDLCQHHEKLLGEINPAPLSQNNSNKKQHNHKLEQTKPCPLVDNESDKNDKSLLIAIINRLRFTYHFYACFLVIHRSLLDEHWDIGTQTDAQLVKTAKSVHASMLSCDQHLEKCLEYIEKWQDTIELGIQPESRTSDNTPIDGDYPTIMGFEPFINHKLLNPTYPRCHAIKRRPFAVEYLKNLVIKLRQCIIVSNSFNQKSFNKSSESIENFSKYFRPSSCVISRSLLQALYLPNRSMRLFKDELLRSMTDYCEPLVQEMKKDEAQFSALNCFLDECSKLFSQIIIIYGHNPVRQHEKFTELILAFKNLQYSTYVVTFKTAIVYSWTTYHLAKLCIKHVLSSFELELFSTHEYPYVFWYLYDVLYRNEREQLELAKQMIHKSQSEADGTPKKSKGKKQRKKNQFSTKYHDISLLCNDAFRFLTGGLFLLTYGLKVQNKIKSPLMECTSEEICFEHRFGFLTGTNVYQSYRQTLSRLEKLEYIYREALECFSEAKDLFEALKQHENCLRVCKTNMIVARILSTNFNSLTDREVEFCFDTHPSFPTVRV